MSELNIYIAGKVNPDSVMKRHDWRDAFCQKLSELSGIPLVNLDPTKGNGFELDEGNSNLIFGHDCFMIKSADLVIVNLTDDISVGGSQEMLIAKYFGKPLIGIAPVGGKFRPKEKEIQGKMYKNYTHPFVAIPCDYIVESLEEAADLLAAIRELPVERIKTMNVVDEAIEYYQKKYHQKEL